MTGAAPEAESTAEQPAVDVIESGKPPSRPSRRLLLLVAVIAAVSLPVAVLGARHHPLPRAAVPDEVLLTTGSTDRVATDQVGRNEIAFDVENLGHYAVTVEPPQIEAPGMSVVSTTGAGHLDARQSATLTIWFALRCSENHNAQRAAAIVLVPYVSAAGRRHEIRETATSATAGPGRALGQVIDTACA